MEEAFQAPRRAPERAEKNTRRTRAESGQGGAGAWERHAIKPTDPARSQLRASPFLRLFRYHHPRRERIMRTRFVGFLFTVKPFKLGLDLIDRFQHQG